MNKLINWLLVVAIIVVATMILMVYRGRSHQQQPAINPPSPETIKTQVEKPQRETQLRSQSQEISATGQIGLSVEQ